MTKHQTHRIAGDWMVNGYIDNLGRKRALSIAVVNGRAYDLDYSGQPDLREPPLTIDIDGAIEVGGGSVTFLPDAGEIDRVGRHLFGQ